jgi:hypothetical protein
MDAETGRHVRRAAVGDAVTIARLNQHVHVLHAEAEPHNFRGLDPTDAVGFFESLLEDRAHVLRMSVDASGGRLATCGPRIKKGPAVRSPSQHGRCTSTTSPWPRKPAAKESGSHLWLRSSQMHANEASPGSHLTTARSTRPRGSSSPTWVSSRTTSACGESLTSKARASDNGGYAINGGAAGRAGACLGGHNSRDGSPDARILAVVRRVAACTVISGGGVRPGG